MLIELTEHELAARIRACLRAGGYHDHLESVQSPRYALAVARKPNDDTSVVEIAPVPYWQVDGLTVARAMAALLRADPALTRALVVVEHLPSPCVRITAGADQLSSEGD